jgi:hypothetical protein
VSRFSERVGAVGLAVVLAVVPLTLATDVVAAEGSEGACAVPPDRAPAAPSPRTGEPLVGVLQADGADLEDLADHGVDAVVLGVAWSRMEPSPGCFDGAYVAQVVERARAARAHGMQVVLDAGLQYVPSWVLELPHARFVNQYGDAWRGPVGSDVPDAVFNDEVRRRQGLYLQALGDFLAELPLAGVRVGGLGNGELHYPLRTYGGHQDSLWAFSAAARAASPVPGFVPGRGSVQQAGRFLRWYLDSLNAYAVWLSRQYRGAFGDRLTQHLLLPSWGMRPGFFRTAVATGLDGTSHPERIGVVAEGLDWGPLAKAMAREPGPVELYSTWVDAPFQDAGAASEAPVRYLGRLGRRHGLRIGGENTGSGVTADMRRTFVRARRFGLSSVFWMSAAQLVDGRYATLDDLARFSRQVSAG